MINHNGRSVKHLGEATGLANLKEKDMHRTRVVVATLVVTAFVIFLILHSSIILSAFGFYTAYSHWGCGSGMAAASQPAASAKSIDSEWIIRILQGFLTPVIAFLTIYIACQQHKTARSQYRLNLYEKRFAIFVATLCFLQDIGAKGKTSYDRVEKFQLAVAEAEFLFEKDVVDLLEKMRTNGIDMASCQEQMYPADGSQGLPGGEERNKVSQKQCDLSKWFREHRVQLSTIFAAYMKCEK
jgi:hypothetical protein